MELNNNQTEARARINEFLKDPSKGSFLLMGYAGTGKSFLTQTIIEDARLIGFQPEACAYTHKATKVLEKFMGGKIPVKTVFSFLNMRPKAEVGKEEDDENFTEPQPKIVLIKTLLIVDECSMINEAIYEAFEKSIERSKPNLKVLYIGDPAQLRPVKSDEKFKGFEKLESVTLTEVVRQKQGELSDFIFEIRKHGLLPKNFSNFKGNDKALIEKMSNAKIEDFKILAYKNNTVIHYNNIVREYYGFDKMKLNDGEILVPLKTVYDSPRPSTIDNVNNMRKKENGLLTGKFIFRPPFLFNSVEYRVEYEGFKNQDMKSLFKDKPFLAALYGTFEEHWANHEVHQYKLYSTIDDEYETYFIPSDEQLRQLKNVIYVKNLAYQIRKSGKKPTELLLRCIKELISLRLFPDIYRTIQHDIDECYFTALACVKYFSHKCIFLDPPNEDEKVKIYPNFVYGYALTVHKSQGSTYKDVYLKESDFSMLKDKDFTEYKSLLYTGVSRASNNLFVF